MNTEKELFLDVSLLEPCEPMERALSACSELADGQYLRLIHRREPHLLYPILAERGFLHHTVSHDTGFEIIIWRHDDESAERNASLTIGGN